MQEFYNDNTKFKAYVNKYCNTYGYTVSEALEHAIVKAVAEEYKGVKK